MKRRNWFWGIFFLLSAVFVIGSQLNSFVEIGVISIIATILLVALMVESIFQRNFFGVFVPIAFLYSIYSKPLHFMEISIWLLLLAAVLTSMGFSFIFKKHPKDWHRYSGHHHDWHGQKGEDGQVEKSGYSSETIDDNNPYAKVSFGSASRYLHGSAIKSGHFIASFGALEVYFDQAQLAPEGAEIFLECSFGAIELYIPRNWQVRDNLQTSFAGVDNEAKFARADANLPVLTLSGTVSLGGIEIHYI